MMKETKKGYTFFGNMKKVWQYTKECRLNLMGFAFISILEAVIGAVLPFVSANIILNVTNGSVQQLIISAIIVYILNIIQNLNFYLKTFFYRKIYQKTVTNLQIAVAKETLKLEIKEIDKTSSGVFIERLNKDTQDISSMFMEYAYWLSYIISNIGVLITIFVLSKYLFIYAIITSICVFTINKIRLSKQYIVQKKVKKIHEKKTGFTSELVRGIRDIKVLNANAAILNNTQKKIVEATTEETNMIRIKSLYNYYENNVKSFSDFFFIIVGCILYSKSLITIPVFLITFNYQGRIKSLLSGIVQILEYNKKFTLASERIFEIIEDSKFSKEKFGNKKVNRLIGKISFINVKFSYNKNKMILNNMNFIINPNEKVAFVGKSGVGKTTIFNLITRLYHVDEGSILLDDNNIEDLNCNSIRNNMSIITQNPYIFNLSIKENLLLANQSATMEEIREACKLAYIDDFIMTLPDKYETIIGENGIIFSGGQRQRIAIARALLTKAQIVLFDEATSALDNETQDKIQRAIENLKGKYTLLIIAHRLSTIIDCDKIFVVDGGKIIDSGTHEYLIDNCHIYRELYFKETDCKC